MTSVGFGGGGLSANFYANDAMQNIGSGELELIAKFLQTGNAEWGVWNVWRTWIDCKAFVNRQCEMQNVKNLENLYLLHFLFFFSWIGNIEKYKKVELIAKLLRLDNEEHKMSKILRIENLTLHIFTTNLTLLFKISIGKFCDLNLLQIFCK